MKTRAETLRAIESQAFDICVIGAGATGAGCALDAQLRGLRTALVDAGDFGSATSSASTKLVHGGVRYLQEAVVDLAPGQIKVVREALRERVLMLQNAPHLAHAREFVVPCFSRFESWYYALGMKLYDWIAGDAKLGRSQWLTPAQVLSALPTLTRENLVGGVSYQDGQFDDARYCLALVKTFASVGGEAANYLKVTSFQKDSAGRIQAAIVEDRCTGQSLTLRARTFVNATGPFSDSVRMRANPAVLSRLVLSRGAHILLPLVGDATPALLIPKTEDGRVIFAIPWLGRLLVGTTDQEVTLDGDLTVTRDEAEYLLQYINRYSTLHYTAQDVVSAFAGVRPLVRAKQSKETRKLIRGHEVDVDALSGLVSILGGKWTTYRAMAEETIDVVQRQLGAGVPSSTRRHRLIGTDGYNPEDWRLLATEHELGEAEARYLMQKFGSEAAEVLAVAGDHPDLKSRVVAGAPSIQAEIVYCARKEMALTIEDVLARRLGLQFYSWKLSIEAAPKVGFILAHELGWSEDRRNLAIQEYVSRIEGQLAALTS